MPILVLPHGPLSFLFGQARKLPAMNPNGKTGILAAPVTLPCALIHIRIHPIPLSDSVARALRARYLGVPNASNSEPADGYRRPTSSMGCPNMNPTYADRWLWRGHRNKLFGKGGGAQSSHKPHDRARPARINTQNSTNVCTITNQARHTLDPKTESLWNRWAVDKSERIDRFAVIPVYDEKRRHGNLAQPSAISIEQAASNP